MKYKEKFVGTKGECLAQLRSVFTNLLNERLEVEGEMVEMPDDKELEYKIKYEDVPEMEGSVAIKIAWSYIEEPEEEEEEPEDEFVL
ncbi:transcription initiation factor IIE [Wukongibacter baidiensis]|uniref:amphi-Trp domain-containing protein n=1 Tax=Wukongibacter baidiensis TaxID=1723361 RepID=UPI003D7FAB29